MIYLAILLFSVFSYAGESALQCAGIKSNNRDIRYDINLTGLKQNNVIVTNSATKEQCTCKYRFTDYFDQSQGVAPQHSITMVYQSCDNKCSKSLKRQISAHINVKYSPRTGESYSTPFVRGEISKCEKFNIDLHAIRRIAAEEIANMDMSPEFKQRLKSIKGLDTRK